jgi:signal transduction histidine kinase/CheY-like chemotaxis protein
MPQPDSNLVELFDDDPSTGGAVAPTAAPWKVLIVDDDAEVHAATRFALAGAEILGRPLELISAHAAEEARAALLVHPDAAVILLDVVMEDHDSGLRFAEWARAEGFASVRIILRTGQPGYAPEMDVIRSYDINDYRSKSELTQTRLLTAMTTAIRSYDQIETVQRSRRGLEAIVAGCTRLLGERDLPRFAAGVLSELADLLGVAPDGIVCAAQPDAPSRDLQVIGGVGPHARLVGMGVSALSEDALSAAARSYADDGAGEPAVPTRDRPAALFTVQTRPGRRYIVALAHAAPLDAIGQALLRAYAASVAAGFENIELIEALERRNVDLERFAFAAAHDLQEPLRKIAVISDLVLETEGPRLDEAGRGRLLTVHRSAAHMRKLVRGLLEYVTIGGQGPAAEDVALTDALIGAERAARSAIEAAGATFETEPLPAVHAERVAVVRVLTLLIENAVAYRREEPLNVRISAQAAGENVVLTFADNGQGFDPARKDEIFDAFKRLHRNAEVPGSGLGLSICRRLVEHQGGRVWAEGVPGEGATVFVQLPKARGAEPAG